MRLIGFLAGLLAYGSALHLHIDRQQTNIGPILGHMNTAQLDEHGPSHVIIKDPQHEGDLYAVTTDANDTNRFTASLISAIGSGLAGVMTQWLGQLAGGVIPIIGDIGSSVAQTITGGIAGQGAAEDNYPEDEDYPSSQWDGAKRPVKPCKPKPNKPHKPHKPHKPIGYLVHVPQQGNYLVLNQSFQNSSKQPEKSSTEQADNKEPEESTSENKDAIESTTAEQQTIEETQVNNNKNETVTNA